MDMTPPQAPPALTVSQNQAALDTLKRLADVQRWLAEQRAAMPEVPDGPATDGKDAFLDRLTDFWRAPVTLSAAGGETTRATALAMQLAAAMRDDANLLGLDGTLDRRAVEWALAFARSPRDVPAHLRASELLIGDVPYAGAVVLQERGTDDLALLFTPDGGWEAFPDMSALHDAAEWRMREWLVSADELPGILTEDIDRVIEGQFVSSRDAGPDAFDVLVARIAGVQEQRVAGAWDDFAAGIIDATGLIDRVRDSLDLSDHLDVHGMLARRDARLGEAVARARLADVPAAVRDDWYHARKAWHDALAKASQQRHALGLHELLSIDAFAEDALRRRLVERGVSDAPRDIVVRATERPTDPVAWLSNLFSGTVTSRVGLVELAYQNIGGMDSTGLAAERFDGTPLSASLDAQAIRQIVRDTDLAARYTRYLDNALLHSAEGRASRAIASELHRARMRFELEESRLSYYLEDEPRAFGHADRDVGYRWLKAVVDAPNPATRPTVDGHTIVARQITYRGVPLADIFEVGTQSRGSSSRVLYYTPDAPDGIAFREFHSREEAARALFHHPDFEAYLLDRLPAEFAETAANGTRHFKESEAASRNRWVFAQENAELYTRMEENLVERDVAGDLIDVSYDTAVALMRANVASLSRSTEAADWQAALHALAVATATANPVTTLAAHLAQETVRQAANTMPALWRMEHNVKAGNHPQAFLDFVEAYHSSLNVIGARPAVSSVLSAGRLVRASGRPRTLLPSRQRIASPESLFETRFQARGVDAAAAESIKDGVLRIRGGQYIQQDGHLYAVRFDTSTGTGTWRLTRNGTLDANYTGPAIERSTSGTWQYARGIGLHGGFKDSLHRLVGQTVPAALDRRVARLTPEQLRRLISELTALAGSRTAALEIYASMRPANAATRGLAPPITQAQRAHWHRALRQAEAMSPRAAAPAARVTPLTTAPRAPVPSSSSAGLPAASESTVTVGAATRASSLTTSLAPLRNGLLVELRPAAWPDTVWIYLSREEVAARAGATDIRLPQVRVAQNRVQGVVGLSLPPGTPALFVEGMPRAAVRAGDTLGSIAGGWVRVDLRAVRARVGADGLPLFRLSMTGAPGSSGVVINPPPTMGDPQALRDVWLTAGEFELGNWGTLPTTQR